MAERKDVCLAPTFRAGWLSWGGSGAGTMEVVEGLGGVVQGECK